MRLIHYSNAPLKALYSREHKEHVGGIYKTPGLWVSVEGPDDWRAWCESEQFHLGSIETEIVLHPSANVLLLSSASDIDAFSRQFVPQPCAWDCRPDWQAVRQLYQGLIIAPYIWERRFDNHAGWYYSWDCASGVIWDVSAIAETKILDFALHNNPRSAGDVSEIVALPPEAQGEGEKP